MIFIATFIFKVKFCLLIIIFLIPNIKTEKTNFKDRNSFSKEQDLSDDSRPKSYSNKPKTLVNFRHGNLIDEDSSEQDEQKTDYDTSDYKNKIKNDIKYFKKNQTTNRTDESSKSSLEATNSSVHIPNKSINDDRQNESDEKTEPIDEKKDEKATGQSLNKGPSEVYINKSTKPAMNVGRRHRELSIVTDNTFPYMAVVLKEAKYVCAGALIDESWVLTAASGIHLMTETIRFLRIRLGSINYKKGGTVLPVKYLEIHPYFNSNKPTYDLALIMLSKPVRFTANTRSIRLQLTPKEVTSTHFIMTSWPGILKPRMNQTYSTEVTKHRRFLFVTHLHPSDPEDCIEELRGIGANADGVMCLENGVDDHCVRDLGAPVVVNGVLWGIISSWKPEECDEDTFSFATLVSARNISTWIYATVHGYKWHHPRDK